MAALYNRVSIFDKVIYAGILAFSIYDYARLIDTGSVDRTVALLCLVLNCVIMYVIYSLVKTCMKYMVKPHLIDIRNEFRDEGNDRLPAVIPHTDAKKKQSRPFGEHRQVAFAIQLAAHCTFPSPSFGGQGVLSYPPYKKCRASPALVPTDSQKSANRIHISEGLKLRKQPTLPCWIPFNDSTISTVIGVFSFH